MKAWFLCISAVLAVACGGGSARDTIEGTDTGLEVLGPDTGQGDATLDINLRPDAEADDAADIAATDDGNDTLDDTVADALVDATDAADAGADPGDRDAVTDTLDDIDTYQGPPPAIISFTASPQWGFSTLAGTTLTPVFENGTGVIQPGDITVTSGQEIPVTPPGRIQYILTVTGHSGETARATLNVYPSQTWALGNHFTVAIKPDTTAIATGVNVHSALGDGSTTSRTEPVPITGLGEGVIQISGGSTGASALKADGSVWAWGLNNCGEVGDGTTDPRSEPVEVIAVRALVAEHGKPVAVASALQYTLLLMADGTVWVWGTNRWGVFGNGNVESDYVMTSTTPVQVPGISDVVAIAAGELDVLALKSDGSVWCWGDYNCQSLAPKKVIEDLAVGICAVGESMVILKSDGTVWGFGTSPGNGESTHKGTAVQATGLTDVVAIAAARYHTLALLSDGTVWAWGDNHYNQLGDGTATWAPTPVQLTLTDIVGIAAGYYHAFALDSSGRLWGWGINSGALGNGSTADIATPTLISQMDL